MISKKDLNIPEERQRILLQTNEFVCLLPHPGLRACISSYNITFPTKDIMPDGFTEIPSGCATLSIEHNGRNLIANLDGPATKPFAVGNQVNQLEMLITVEFKPAGFHALTGINQNELIDQTISFEAINPKLSKSLSESVEKSKTVCELAASLDTLFLYNMCAGYHPQLVLALQNIVDCSGNIDVKRLSSDIHYSERQLNRIFRQHVGVSAKSFSRLIRIHNTFQLLQQPDASITLISDVMGFYDLSHFIRDFRSVCGVTPQEYRRNMSDFYINPLRL